MRFDRTVRLGLISAVHLLTSALMFGEEQWIFLKDGQIGWSNPNQSPLEIVLRSGKRLTTTKEAIAGTRTARQMYEAVAAMLKDPAVAKNACCSICRNWAKRSSARITNLTRPYRYRGTWSMQMGPVTGYLAVDGFEAGRHGWTDPQHFIANYPASLETLSKAP